MYENKQSESEIIPWQQVIVHYHEMRLVHNNEYKIYCMHIKMQDKDQTIFIKYSS